MEKAAKRVGPPEVEPITIKNIRYEALHWARERGLKQNGGYIVAYDKDTNKELWILKVYTIEYDPKLERDNQDIFISKMDIQNGKLIVENEAHKKYSVNLDTKEVDEI